MVDIPFSWNLDLQLNRMRTLYGSGDDPVLPYEPPSSVIKVSKYKLGTVLGLTWTLQFEHAKVYDRSFYGQEEKAVVLLTRDGFDEKVQIEGTISLYDISSHKCLSKCEFERDLKEGQCSVNLTLDIPMCELSHAVFENSQLCLQGNIAISALSTDDRSDTDLSTKGQTSAVQTHVIKKDPLVELSSDLCSLLDEGSFSDVTIKCGDTVLKGHKNIMSSRSSVFAAMFRTSMSEGVGNELIITDMTPPVVQKMLTFMYSGRVKDLDDAMVYDLLFAGDKYELDGLVAFCVEYLKSHLSADNALQTLYIANLYSADADLKDYVMEYVVRHFSIFEDTDEWEELKKDSRELATEVLEHVVRFMRKKK